MQKATNNLSTSFLKPTFSPFSIAFWPNFPSEKLLFKHRFALESGVENTFSFNPRQPSMATPLAYSFAMFYDTYFYDQQSFELGWHHIEVGLSVVSVVQPITHDFDRNKLIDSSIIYKEPVWKHCETICAKRCPIYHLPACPCGNTARTAPGSVRSAHNSATQPGIIVSPWNGEVLRLCLNVAVFLPALFGVSPDPASWGQASGVHDMPLLISTVSLFHSLPMPPASFTLTPP